MNNLQNVELELFKVFKDACEKLNLNYFLVCGSCLGAARHGGFIPWDDDMDVGMFREDYNKFMELAPSILPEGIFLQNYKTDPKYRNISAKLRNCNTTYIESSVKDVDINHGVFLDIFPLDGYPIKKRQQKIMMCKRVWYVYKIIYSSKQSSIKGKIISLMFKILGGNKNTAKFLAKYEKAITKYPISKSKFICNHGTWYGSRDFIAKKYYGVGTDLTYEGVNARVPELYDNYLTSLYGDWRTPPPVEKQKGHHYYEVCDTEKPYTYYMDLKK